jgi:AcrR family transcriptional regulator
MARPQDPNITAAVLEAAIGLLAERGFGALSVAAIAERAGVGKPAIYRRFASKEDVVMAAIASALPMLHAPATTGDARRRFRRLLDEALPADADGYVAMIGGLMAEHRRHPGLIRAFRETILLPRRAIGRAAVEHAQRSGELRADIDPEHAIDLLAGPFLARVFAGLDVGPNWRDQAFELWWSAVHRPVTRPRRAAGR